MQQKLLVGSAILGGLTIGQAKVTVMYSFFDAVHRSNVDLYKPPLRSTLSLAPTAPYAISRSALERVLTYAKRAWAAQYGLPGRAGASQKRKLEVPGSPIGQQHSVILYDDIRADGVTIPDGVPGIVVAGLTPASGFASCIAEVSRRQAMLERRAGMCGGGESRGGL